MRLQRILVALSIAAGIMVSVALPAEASPRPAARPVPTGLLGGVGTQAGLVTDLTWYIPRSDMDRTIAILAASGTQWVRANVAWSDLEQVKGQLDPWWLSTIDYAVTQLAARHIQVLMPLADGVPYWASADPSKYIDAAGVKHWNKYWRPVNNADYASFARRIAGHYAPLGVHAYEIWNEPNYPQFWPSGPNPAQYAALLKAAYPAVKAADPSATVVLGGLSKSDTNFLAGVYAAGAGPSFDVAAIHPYTGGISPTLCWKDSNGLNAEGALCGLQNIRALMVAHGDAAKQIWLTELGWSTCTCPTGVSEALQASYVSAALAILSASYPYVTKTFIYSLRNVYWLNNNPVDVEANYGLLRTDFTAKPAYLAFQTYALAHRLL